MSENTKPKTGHITCRRCGSRVQQGKKVWRLFCINQECAESEGKWDK